VSFHLDEEVKKRLEDVAGLDQAVSRIVTELQTNESGEEAVHIAIGLSSTFEIDKPSASIGRKLNAIASAIRARSAELPVPLMISFFKEEAA
jgi:hypothetical protein